MRKTAREIAFKLIFEYGYTKNENQELFNQLILENLDDITNEDRDFARSLYVGSIGSYDELKGDIQNAAIGFKADRLFKADLSLMILALYEIKYIKTPSRIVINEILNLSKIYCEGKSNSYINGILATFVANSEKVDTIDAADLAGNTGTIDAEIAEIVGDTANIANSEIEIEKVEKVTTIDTTITAAEVEKVTTIDTTITVAEVEKAATIDTTITAEKEEQV